MKKIELYLSDNEYQNLMKVISEYQKCIVVNENDGVYSDQERAEIINSFGSIPFYVTKGIRKQLEEMKKYNEKCKKKIENKQNIKTEKEPEKQFEIPKDEKKPVNTESEQEEIECETQTGDSADFDFNLEM